MNFFWRSSVTLKYKKMLIIFDATLVSDFQFFLFGGSTLLFDCASVIRSDSEFKQIHSNLVVGLLIQS
jgi:hypothetical protein